MFEIRWLEQNDYDELCQWWKSWRWKAPNRELLPDNGKCGIMVSKNNVHICAGFIYLTNSKFAIIEYIISNFEVKDRKVRKQGLKLLIKSLNQIGANEGYTIAFTSLKNESLKNVYLETGYTIGTMNSIEMIKKL
ncbi:hypothetical protein [Aquimarina longa]|uniref:hypothetical protein n=1 Tax=Aquimarina longa TaxID=1080221 RepID=UPI000782360E|nr:hypothetical protein [Aquimarina longa]